MSERFLQGRRVVVVGASAGIGRAVARRVVEAGAQVVVAARRGEVLDAVVTEAGGGAAVATDVRTPVGRRRLIDAATRELGSIDLFVNTAGTAQLRFLRNADDEVWHEAFAMNVIAHNELLKAAVPHMAGHGVLCVLSSETSSRPRHGLVPYAASKAALEASMAGWRLEHPELRFSCLVVGATYPTDFGRGFDGEVLADALDRWGGHGLLQRDVMSPDDVAGVLVATMGSALAHPSVSIETMVLRSPSPVADRFVAPDADAER